MVRLIRLSPLVVLVSMLAVGMLSRPTEAKGPKSEIAELAARVDALEARAAALEAKCAELESRATQSEAQVAALARTVSTLQPQVLGLQGLCSDLEARLTAAETDLAGLSVLPAQVGALDQRIVELETETRIQVAHAGPPVYGGDHMGYSIWLYSIEADCAVQSAASILGFMSGPPGPAPFWVDGQQSPCQFPTGYDPGGWNATIMQGYAQLAAGHHVIQVEEVLPLGYSPAGHVVALLTPEV